MTGVLNGSQFLIYPACMDVRLSRNGSCSHSRVFRSRNLVNCRMLGMYARDLEVFHTRATDIIKRARTVSRDVWKFDFGGSSSSSSSSSLLRSRRSISRHNDPPRGFATRGSSSLVPRIETRLLIQQPITIEPVNSMSDLSIGPLPFNPPTVLYFCRYSRRISRKTRHR